VCSSIIKREASQQLPVLFISPALLPYSLLSFQLYNKERSVYITVSSVSSLTIKREASPLPALFISLQRNYRTVWRSVYDPKKKKNMDI